MRILQRIILVVCFLAVSGCATRHSPIELHRGQEIFNDRSIVGILVQLPVEPDVFPSDPIRGGQLAGLIPYGIFAGITSKLSSHAKALSFDELRATEGDLLKALKGRGVDATVLKPDILKDFKPERFDAKDGSSLNVDLRPLRTSLGIDRLLRVNITQLGFNYPFAGALIPTPAGDPMAWVDGEVYLVDLRTNAFQWYKKVRTLRGVGVVWDEPPSYPGLTSKYFEVLETAKDEIVDDLLK